MKQIKLKQNNVVSLYRSSDRTVHNMIIIKGCEGHFIAQETHLRNEQSTICSDTCANYCYLNIHNYPNTLGIDTCFGDIVLDVYKGIGCCEDNLITHFDQIPVQPD